MGKLIIKANKKIILYVVIILLLLIIPIFYLTTKNTDDISKNDGFYDNFYEKEAAMAAEQPVPEDKDEALRYFNDTANSYYSAGDKAKALEFYLKAQATLETTETDEGYSYYRIIAELSRDTGDRRQALEYYDKEITEVGSRADPADEQYINDLKRARDEL